MTHIIDIITTDWDDGTEEPASGKEEENEFINDYYEGIVGRWVAFNDMYIGILGSDHFSEDSHDVYRVEIVAETLARFQEILLEIKRICSQHEPTSVDNVIEWQGGDTNHWNNTRFRGTFLILIAKAGISIT